MPYYIPRTYYINIKALVVKRFNNIITTLDVRLCRHRYAYFDTLWSFLCNLLFIREAINFSGYSSDGLFQVPVADNFKLFSSDICSKFFTQGRMEM